MRSWQKRQINSQVYRNHLVDETIEATRTRSIVVPELAKLDVSTIVSIILSRSPNLAHLVSLFSITKTVETGSQINSYDISYFSKTPRLLFNVQCESDNFDTTKTRRLFCFIFPMFGLVSLNYVITDLTQRNIIAL